MSLPLLPPHLRIKHKDGALWLKIDNQGTKLSSPKRALPLSAPDEWIILVDESGEEIGMIRRVDDLEAASRETLREALEDAYRITRIARVLDVEREPLSGHIHWSIEIEETANAPESEDGHVTRETSFSIAGAEDVQTARYPQIFITDIDGNRYEIPNCEELDLTSRRAAERYF
jgi:hypothetical protein